MSRQALTTAVLLGCLVMLLSGASAQMPGMGGGDPTPAVEGFYKGQTVLFIHTEASDPAVAERVTRMMGPKVLVVRSLARIPRSLQGTVYVFTNGVRGRGPFGFQPDVFDSAPGDAAYTPLRAVGLVAWRAGVRARVLRSADAVRSAAAAREISVSEPGSVVNMPMLTWPGGRR